MSPLEGANKPNVNSLPKETTQFGFMVQEVIKAQNFTIDQPTIWFNYSINRLVNQSMNLVINTFYISYAWRVVPILSIFPCQSKYSLFLFLEGCSKIKYAQFQNWKDFVRLLRKNLCLIFLSKFLSLRWIPLSGELNCEFLSLR